VSGQDASESDQPPPSRPSTVSLALALQKPAHAQLRLSELASRARLLGTRTRSSSQQPGPTGQGPPSTVSLAPRSVQKGLCGQLRHPPLKLSTLALPYCSGVHSPPALWLLELVSWALMPRI
jgi:hypothetical protein